MTARAPEVGSIAEDSSPTPERGSRREAAREAIVAGIPATYNPAVHFVVPALLGASVLAASVWLLQDVRPIELLTIPITLFLGLGFEWRVHKSVLHERQPLLHHVVYTYDDMTMRSSREWRLVLMPAYAIVLVFVMMAPIAAAVWYFASRNVALLHLATAMLFFLAYEWMHLAYHLPQEHPIGRLGIVRRLRELHRRHHDPRLMKRWNFNVTVPLFDWIHRSAWSEEREQAWRERRARRGKPITE
jgi:hypothetical protein